MAVADGPVTVARGHGPAQSRLPEPSEIGLVYGPRIPEARMEGQRSGTALGAMYPQPVSGHMKERSPAQALGREACDAVNVSLIPVNKLANASAELIAADMYGNPPRPLSSILRKLGSRHVEK